MRIKYILFKIFFKEYYKLFLDRTSETYELKYNVKQLNDHITQLDDYLKMVKELGNKGYKIIGLENNKDNDFLIIFIGASNYDINIEGYRYGTVKPNLFARKNGKSLHIDDIHAIIEGIGNGSILMKYMFRQAERDGISKITGDLSYVDRDHFDTLEYFYKKHGFEVKFNEDKTEGWIEYTF